MACSLRPNLCTILNDFAEAVRCTAGRCPEEARVKERLDSCVHMILAGAFSYAVEMPVRSAVLSERAHASKAVVSTLPCLGPLGLCADASQ